MSDQKGYRKDEFTQLIDKNNDIEYSSKLKFQLFQTRKQTINMKEHPMQVLSYSQVKQIAIEIGLEFNFKKLANDEYY